MKYRYIDSPVGTILLAADSLGLSEDAGGLTVSIFYLGIIPWFGPSCRGFRLLLARPEGTTDLALDFRYDMRAVFGWLAPPLLLLPSWSRGPSAAQVSPYLIEVLSDNSPRIDALLQ